MLYFLTFIAGAIASPLALYVVLRFFVKDIPKENRKYYAQFTGEY